MENSDQFGFRDKTHLHVALYESKLGNHETAIDHIEKALAIRSNYSNYMGAANILLNFGNMGGNVLEKKFMYQGVGYLKKAHSIKKSVFVLYRIATTLNHLEDKEEADNLFRKIIEKYPKSKYADYSKKHLTN